MNRYWLERRKGASAKAVGQPEVRLLFGTEAKVDEDREPRWINGGEQLFRASAGNYLNADTGQRRDLGFYAQGYRRSAEMLHEAIQNGGYAGSQFFAVAFLWRQALELSLKALHEDLGELEHLEVVHGPPDEARADMLDGKPLSGHDLEKLWRAVEPRLRKIFPSEPETDWILSLPPVLDGRGVRSRASSAMAE